MGTIERQTASSVYNAQTPTDETHTVPSGIECLAVIVPYGRYEQTPSYNYYPPTSITWDQGGVNEALTYIGRVATGPTGWGAIELWVKWNPTPGTNKNLRVNWDGIGAPSQQMFVAFNLEGVDQTLTGTPAVLSVTGSGGAAGDKTVTFNSGSGAPVVAGDIILGGWYDDQGAGSTLTVLNSPTLGTFYQDVAADSDGAAHGWEVDVADKTVGYNITDTTNGDWSGGFWRFLAESPPPPPRIVTPIAAISF